MRKTLILPIIVAIVTVSCQSKSPATASISGKIVGTSPSFTGKKKLTEGMISEGKTIYENSCAKCHELPNPKDYNDEQWVGIVNAMSPKAGLNAKQSELVYDYITFHN